MFMFKMIPQIQAMVRCASTLYSVDLLQRLLKVSFPFDDLETELNAECESYLLNRTYAKVHTLGKQTRRNTGRVLHKHLFALQ